MLLGIGHHDDHAFVVVVPLTGEPAAERGDLGDAPVDVVDRDVEMQPYLAALRLGHGLKDKPGLRVTWLAEVDPAGLGRPLRAVQQRAPESRHSFHVDAVEGHSDPAVRHVVSAPVWWLRAKCRPLLVSLGSYYLDVESS